MWSTVLESQHLSLSNVRAKFERTSAFTALDFRRKHGQLVNKEEIARDFFTKREIYGEFGIWEFGQGVLMGAVEGG